MKLAADRRRSGQAMLIAVLSLGGAILGATAIAGFLTLYQIRDSTDSANSAKAIFAADTGVEWALFNQLCTSEGRCSLVPGSEYSSGTFSNGATMDVNCYDNYDASGAPVLCSDPTAVEALSTGMSQSSERAFYLGIAAATTTYP